MSADEAEPSVQLVVDRGLEVGHERAEEDALGKRVAGALPCGEERFGGGRRKDGGRAPAAQRAAAAGVRGEDARTAAGFSAREQVAEAERDAGERKEAERELFNNNC